MNKEIFVKLLAQRQFKAVRSILDVMNEVDIASLLSDLEDKELALAFRLIPKDKAAEVFANMNNSMQTYLVEMFSEKELKELLDDLYMDDTVDLLEELPANLVNRILDTVNQSDRNLINQLLNYPDDSAGSIMTTEYVDIRETMTVAQTMAHIKETGIHKETIYTCYVTDQRRLLGIVSAKDLMTTADDILIRDLMQTEIISVTTHTDKEEVAQLFTKYDFLAIPVLDQDERMVGIVTFDDAMDVMVDLLMLQRILEHIERRRPLGTHLLNRLQHDLGIARIDVVHQDAGMILLLAELDEKPVGHTFQPLVLGVHRHRKIKIGRPQLGVDLRIQCVM